MKQSFTIHTDFISPNFDKRRKKIDTIVLHSTHMSFNESMKRLCDPSAKVSSHYLIDLKGKTYQLVEEKKRAWHAGISSWKGKSSLNNNSIGIELVDENTKGIRIKKFPKPQMESLITLLKILIKKYKILKHNVIAHSDIASDRKDDPGEHFNWPLLASHNVAQYHNAVIKNEKEQCFLNPKNATIKKIKDIQRMLKEYGYKIKITGKFDDQTKEVITAFRRRFNPKNLKKNYFNSIDFKILLSLTQLE